MNETELLNKGYVPISETKGYTVFELPKKFSVLALVMWTLFTGFGGIIYAIWHFARQPKREIIKK